MKPAPLFEGRTVALVWPAMPIMPEFLITGRWPQPTPLRQGVGAVVGRKLPVLESMQANGQREAITARFEIHQQDDHRWAMQWPHLNLALHPEVGESVNSVVDLLARRLLIYEGNHRWVIAQMLIWDYVLVEPQLWVYGDFPQHRERVRQQTRLLQDMAPPGFRVGEPKVAQPKRDDQRPISPEQLTSPFWGHNPGQWRPN